ncbi:uncharacterized protein LOC131621780 [Vicia villosa]|uniref:uncharacterized protein LOC131621780 n=1 Tax=Vicia villosa TaxID=3911 RepID=UPI00273B8EA7|nr:uncharacterized protein LOC131621780 [Vicia villosa]
MEDSKNITNFFTKVTKLVNQIKKYGEALTIRAIVSKILRSLAPKFDHVVVAIEDSKDFSKLTKEKLQGTLKSHEQRMTERAAGKSKSDMALQDQSAKEKKGKGSWIGNKGRGGYNNSTGQNQHEGSWSNLRKPSYQGNQKGGVGGRGRGGDRKPNKIPIQCFNCHKYGHYTSDCPEKRENQVSDAKFAKHEEEEMLLMVKTRDEDKTKDQWNGRFELKRFHIGKVIARSSLKQAI